MELTSGLLYNSLCSTGLGWIWLVQSFIKRYIGGGRDPPIDLLASEKSGEETIFDIKQRGIDLSRHEMRYVVSGRSINRFIPNIKLLLSREFGDMSCYLTQTLTAWKLTGISLSISKVRGGALF